MSTFHRRDALAALAGVAPLLAWAWTMLPGRKSATSNPRAEVAVAKPTPPKAVLTRPKLVVLDPGHGGKDPGALGVRGTKEKAVVLAIARGCSRNCWPAGAIGCVLTRSGDSFVALRERVARAQAAERRSVPVAACRFASRFRRARRLRLYAVGGGERPRGRGAGGAREPRGCRRFRPAARQPARQCGAHPGRHEPARHGERFRAASPIRSCRPSAATACACCRAPTAQAGFAVLTSPDIPAALVELGYLSNPQDEKLLDRAPAPDRAGACAPRLGRCPFWRGCCHKKGVRDGHALSSPRGVGEVSAGAGGGVERYAARGHDPSVAV